MNKVKHARTLTNNQGWIHWFEPINAYHFHKKLGIKYSEVFFFLEIAQWHTALPDSGLFEVVLKHPK